MTPVSLNPPGPNSLLQGQNQFFNISPVNQDTPTFFNLLGDFGENHDHHQHQVRSYMIPLFFTSLFFLFFIN